MLVALSDEDHVHHTRALNWWQANSAAGWASCPITQNGFVRILSLPSYPNPVSIPVAIGLLRQLVRATDHIAWPQPVSLMDDTLFNAGRLLGHRQITDAYLLGVAVRNGGRLVTLDARIPLVAVHGATAEHCLLV